MIGRFFILLLTIASLGYAKDPILQQNFREINERDLQELYSESWKVIKEENWLSVLDIANEGIKAAKAFHYDKYYARFLNHYIWAYYFISCDEAKKYCAMYDHYTEEYRKISAKLGAEFLICYYFFNAIDAIDEAFYAQIINDLKIHSLYIEMGKEYLKKSEANYDPNKGYFGLKLKLLFLKWQIQNTSMFINEKEKKLALKDYITEKMALLDDHDNKKNHYYVYFWMP